MQSCELDPLFTPETNAVKISMLHLGSWRLALVNSSMYQRSVFPKANLPTTSAGVFSATLNSEETDDGTFSDALNVTF